MLKKVFHAQSLPSLNTCLRVRFVGYGAPSVPAGTSRGAQGGGVLLLKAGGGERERCPLTLLHSFGWIPLSSRLQTGADPIQRSAVTVFSVRLRSVLLVSVFGVKLMQIQI